MTQVIQDDGSLIGVSALEVLPCTVVQIKTDAVDGYNAIQIGVGKKNHMSKGLAGHLKGLGSFLAI